MACCKARKCCEAKQRPRPETTTGSTRWLAAGLQLACAPGWALCDQPAATCAAHGMHVCATHRMQLCATDHMHQSHSPAVRPRVRLLSPTVAVMLIQS